MQFVRDWSDPERWEWFSDGDADMASDVLNSSQNDNSPRRLLLETGLAFLVPLALAALIEIILGV